MSNNLNDIPPTTETGSSNALFILVISILSIFITIVGVSVLWSNYQDNDSSYGSESGVNEYDGPGGTNEYGVTASASNEDKFLAYVEQKASTLGYSWDTERKELALTVGEENCDSLETGATVTEIDRKNYFAAPELSLRRLYGIITVGSIVYLCPENV